MNWDLTGEPGPLSINDVFQWWSSVVYQAAEAMAPIDSLSLFHPSLVKNNLSSVRLAYFGAKSALIHLTS
jgi:hypothetical protein